MNNNKCQAVMSDIDGFPPLFECKSGGRNCQFMSVIDYTSETPLCKYYVNGDGDCTCLAAKIDVVQGTIVAFRQWMNKNCKGSDL